LASSIASGETAMSESALANRSPLPDTLAGIYAQIAVAGLSVLVDLHPNEAERASSQEKLRDSLVTFAVAKGLSDRMAIFVEIGRALLMIEDL